MAIADRGRSELVGQTVELDHLERGLGSLRALVAERTAGTVESLLLIGDCQHTEYHRNVAIGIERCDTLCDTRAYIVEMRGVTLDDTSEHYYGIESTALYELGCGEGEFDRPGNGVDLQVTGSEA